jgi:hypothetical protein
MRTREGEGQRPLIDDEKSNFKDAGYPSPARWHDLRRNHRARRSLEDSRLGQRKHAMPGMAQRPHLVRFLQQWERCT